MAPTTKAARTALDICRQGDSFHHPQQKSPDATTTSNTASLVMRQAREARLRPTSPARGH